MDRLYAMRVFIEIAEKGSLIKAAKSLNISTSKTTRLLKNLEDWHGGMLIQRKSKGKQEITTHGFIVLEISKKILELSSSIGDISTIP